MTSLLILLAVGIDGSCSEVPLTNAVQIRITDQVLVFRKISPSRDGMDYPDFLMLETEASNAQFKEYLVASKRTKDDTDVLRIVNERKKSNTFSTGDIPYRIEDETMIWRASNYPKGLDDHPVALITLHDAAGFCKWLTERYGDQGLFRLPTWNEWMIAAYGKARSYPWGEDWENDRVHMSYGTPYPQFPKRTESVKNRAKGRTPEGLYGMLGNVGEYVAEGDPTNDDYFNLGSRSMGGGFTTGTFAERDDRVRPRQDYWGYSHYAESRQCDLGFRVVLDPKKDMSLLRRPRVFGQVNKAWNVDHEQESPNRVAPTDP